MERAGCWTGSEAVPIIFVWTIATYEIKLVTVKIDWNEEKNRHLIQTRGISFEVAEEMIRDDSVLLEPHPDQGKYPGQTLLLFKYENYWWVCPAVELDDGFFLKTIYPSRKVTKEKEDG